MKRNLTILSVLLFLVGLTYFMLSGSTEVCKEVNLKIKQVKNETRHSVISEKKKEKLNIPMNVIKKVDNVNIDTVESRQIFYDKLVKEDSKYIYALWVDVLDRKQRRKLNIISDALAWKLQHSDTKENKVYEDLTELYAYSEFKNQMILTDLLGRITTKRSISILLDKLTDLSNLDIEDAIYLAIDSSANNLWDGKFHTELSEPLEKIWRTETNDMKLLSNIGNSIAKIGSKQGSKLLIGKMKDYTLEELKNSKDNQAIAAFNALGKVTNIDSIEVLTDSITTYNEDSAILHGKINALASQRNIVATKALLNWAKNIDMKSNKLIKVAFSKLSDTKSVELVSKSLENEIEEYKDYKVREIILDILKNK